MGQRAVANADAASRSHGAADVAQSSFCGWLRAAAAATAQTATQTVGAERERESEERERGLLLVVFSVFFAGINVSKKYKNGRHSKFSNR